MIAKDLDIDMAEAVMRAEVGSEVSKMSSKELKRDLLVFAKKNPELFLDLAQDENVHIRNIAIKAIIKRLIDINIDIFELFVETIKLKPASNSKMAK